MGQVTFDLTLMFPLHDFHPFLYSRLNILAELLRFGDREFYKDWWNAKTVEEVRGLLKSVFISFPGENLNRTDINYISMHFNAIIFWGLLQYWRMWNMVIFLLHPSSYFFTLVQPALHYLTNNIVMVVTDKHILQVTDNWSTFLSACT